MSARSEDIVAPAPPQLQEVSDGIYAYVQPDGTWWINNTGFVVGSQGVIAVDSCATERRTRAFVDAIASVTSAPVRTLVNTHHHGDHTWGNALFGTATIVAHERAREEMIVFGAPRRLPFWDHPDWGSLPLDPPFLTFTELNRRCSPHPDCGTRLDSGIFSLLWEWPVAVGWRRRVL
jgi:cyclase